MRSLICAALVLHAPAALADDFCTELTAVIAAASEKPEPFNTLIDPATRLRPNGELASFGPARLLAGLPEGARCERYLAYVDGKVVGGGTHNYFACRFGRVKDDDPAYAQTKAAHDALLDRAEACLAPLGWQKQATTKNAYRGGETHAQIIAKPGETIDVRFLSEGTGRQSVLTWSFEVQVRTSAPKP